VIEQILVTDRDAPPKQHHTSKRIFERLRDEYGYSGGITQVKEAVASYRRHHQEVFMPLSHPPGRSQFDFGQALIRIGGVLCKATLAATALPYSDAFHYSAYPRENTETFQAAHVAAFEFFGGVPTRTDYDNTRIAVAKIIGEERQLTREFLRLESHYLGGIKWSSQHLDEEVARWPTGSGRSRCARIGGRSHHRDGRRWRGVRIGSGSGMRSLAA